MTLHKKPAQFRCGVFLMASSSAHAANFSCLKELAHHCIFAKVMGSFWRHKSESHNKTQQPQQLTCFRSSWRWKTLQTVVLLKQLVFNLFHTNTVGINLSIWYYRTNSTLWIVYIVECSTHSYLKYYSLNPSANSKLLLHCIAFYSLTPFQVNLWMFFVFSLTFFFLLSF